MTHDETARRQAVIILRRCLPRPNKIGHGSIYRRRILSERDFEVIRKWLAQFEAGDAEHG